MAGPRHGALIELRRERETPGGWSYDVLRTHGDASSAHAVTLSWADHDHWSGGASPPSRVVESLLAWLADEHPEFEWPARFDASTIRRRFPGVDDTLGRRL